MADLRSLVATLRRYPDPATSAEPVVSALVAGLAALPPGPRPSPRFRAELRAQLVAVTPRLVAEGVTGEAVMPAHRGGRVRAAWRRVPLHRPIAVVGTLVVIFALLLSGAVWLSSSTLPGDSLYGLKRASENVQLSLTSGAGARGKEYLSLAKKRADEVSALLSRASALAAGPGPVAAGGVNDRTAKLVTDTLGDADSDSRNASRLLTGQAVHDLSASPLQAIITWSPDQIARLASIANRIPPSAVHDRAASSVQLAQRVLDRATALRADIRCSCLTSTSTDDLGPLPCTGPCSAAPPSAPAHPGGTSPSGRLSGPGGSVATHPSSGSSPAGTSGSVPLPAIPGLPGSSSAGGTSGSSGSLSPSTTPTSTGPTGQAGGASSPVTLDSCGLSISLGSIGIGLGPCGVKLHL